MRYRPGDSIGARALQNLQTHDRIVMAGIVNKNCYLARFSQKAMTSLRTEQRHRSCFYLLKPPVSESSRLARRMH